MRTTPRFLASLPFASVLALLCALTSVPARGAITQVRVNEFQTACVDSNATIQFIELTPLVDQTFEGTLTIRILNHLGVNILLVNNLFAGQTNGTPWPTGKTWLLASSNFSGATGLTPDRVLAGPASILDPLGGTIILRFPSGGGQFTIVQQFTYGLVGGSSAPSPAPAPGHSLHMVDDLIYGDSSPPDPKTFAGAAPTNLNCVASTVDVSVRVNEFMTACADGNAEVQFLELAPTVDQTFDSGLTLLVMDHSGQSILERSDLFAGKANGTYWPAGKPWLIGSGGFASATGLDPDLVVTSPASILDPAGGTVMLRVRNPGGSYTTTQQVAYGSAGGTAAPAPGGSIHRVNDQTYTNGVTPDPTTFGGATVTNIDCLTWVGCPQNTINGVLYSTPSQTASGYGFSAQYDVPSGTCSASGFGVDYGGGGSVSVLDLFTLTGLAKGTPVDIVARLHSMLSATAQPGTDIRVPGHGGANARIQSTTNVVQIGVSASANNGYYNYADLDTTLSLPLHVLAGHQFLLSFGSSGGGLNGGGHGNAELSFSGLPPGARISSCQGYATDSPTAVTVSLSTLDATPDRVRIAWTLADTRTSNVTLERSGSDRVWSTLATLTRDGRGEVAYEDLDVRAGGRYGYRLRILTTQGVGLAGETWVDIPSEARLSLGGAVPNPAIDRLVVSFALASAESATLYLLDIAGRRVIHRDVSAFGPGLHRVDLGSTYGLEAGIYLLRLSQGSGSQVRRISLLH